MSSSSNRSGRQGVCSSTRGVFGGSNILDFITIASTGNAQDFGDMVNGIATGSGCSPVRGVFIGGFPVANIIEYITIQTTGNAQDFRDLTTASTEHGSCSNGHGGL